MNIKTSQLEINHQDENLSLSLDVSLSSGTPTKLQLLQNKIPSEVSYHCCAVSMVTSPATFEVVFANNTTVKAIRSPSLLTPIRLNDIVAGVLVDKSTFIMTSVIQQHIHSDSSEISTENLLIQGRTLSIQTSDVFQVCTAQANVLANKADANIQEASIHINTFLSTIQKYLGKFITSIRRVETLDVHEAASRNDTISANYYMRAGTARFSSSGTIQMNASKIFMN